MTRRIGIDDVEAAFTDMISRQRQPQGWNQGLQPPRQPPPCQPAASTVGAAAIVAGWAGAGADVTTTWPQKSLVA